MQSVKNLIVIFIFAFVCPVLSAQTPSSINKRSVEFITTTAYINIAGMACQEGCADTIANNLEETKGIQSAEVSYTDGKAIIKFDDSRIRLKEIEAVITNTKVKNYVYTIKNSVLKNHIVR